MNLKSKWKWVRKQMSKPGAVWALILCALITAGATMLAPVLNGRAGTKSVKPLPPITWRQLIRTLLVDLATGDMGSDAETPIRQVFEDFATRYNAGDEDARYAAMDFFSTRHPDAIVAYYSADGRMFADYDRRIGLALLSILRAADTGGDIPFSIFSEAERGRPELSLLLMTTFVNSQQYRRARNFTREIHPTPAWSQDQALRLRVLTGVAERPLRMDAALGIHATAMEEAENAATVEFRTKVYAVTSYVATALSCPIPSNKVESQEYLGRLKLIESKIQKYSPEVDQATDKLLKLQWHSVRSNYEFAAAFYGISHPDSIVGESPRAFADRHFAEAENSCKTMEGLIREIDGSSAAGQLLFRISILRGRMALVRQQWPVVQIHIEAAVHAAALPQDKIDAQILRAEMTFTRFVATYPSGYDPGDDLSLIDDADAAYAVALGLAIDQKLDSKVTYIKEQMAIVKATREGLRRKQKP